MQCSDTPGKVAAADIHTGARTFGAAVVAAADAEGAADAVAGVGCCGTPSVGSRCWRYPWRTLSYWFSK